MTEPLSSTVKAGQLICLLGWLTLAFSIFTSVAIVLIFVAQGEPIELYLWALLGAAIAVSLAILEVGDGVKKNKTWAKVLGAIVSVLYSGECTSRYCHRCYCNRPSREGLESVNRGQTANIQLDAAQRPDAMCCYTAV